jgi:hypothetical protein
MAHWRSVDAQVTHFTLSVLPTRVLNDAQEAVLFSRRVELARQHAGVSEDEVLNQYDS